MLLVSLIYSDFTAAVKGIFSLFDEFNDDFIKGFVFYYKSED